MPASLIDIRPCAELDRKPHEELGDPTGWHGLHVARGSTSTRRHNNRSPGDMNSTALPMLGCARHMSDALANNLTHVIGHDESRAVSAGRWSRTMEKSLQHLRRLRLLAALTANDEAALTDAFDTALRIPSETLLSLGDRALILATGWAGLVREAADGGRGVLQIALPGDVIQPVRRKGARWRALTPVTIFEAPDEEGCPGLAAAYRLSAKIDMLNYESQIARLAMMSSAERYIDLLVELDARLSFVGHTTGASFHMPLSQVGTAEVLGITGVHINRTRRALMEGKFASFERGTAQLAPRLRSLSLERQRVLLEA